MSTALPFLSMSNLYTAAGAPLTWKRFVWRCKNGFAAPRLLLAKPTAIAIERHGPTGTYGHLPCSCVEKCREHLPTSFEHADLHCGCEACELALDDYYDDTDWAAAL